jgi:tripartite ATP-independent transporter DctP family solute receptor
MRKLMTVTMVLLLAITAAFANAAVEEAESKTVTLRWGNVFGPDIPFNQGVSYFKQMVEEKSGGRIKIEFYPSSQLGGNGDLMGMLIEGTNQIGNEGGGFLSDYASKFLVSEAVYAFNSVDHMLKVMNGELGQEMYDQLLEERGIRVIDVWYYGTRHITSNKLIDTPADMAGLKMRVPNGPLYISNGTALGATPTPLALSEVYLALQTGVIDAQENPLPTINSNKFNEVQKYLILTGHNYNFNVIMVNDEFWQSLSESDKALISECIKEAGEYQKKISLEQEKSLINDFKAAGMIVHTPDVAAFRKQAGEYMVKTYSSQWGEGFYETIQAQE